MALGRKQGCNYLGWLVVLGLQGAIASIGNCVFAQVAPDVTLHLNSVVRSNGKNFTIFGRGGLPPITVRNREFTR
ncbi:MAG: hypothetical protein PUP92_24410 [Rhizonema sp. PD38]|nr:hypothetical protein [Rhizonema sp. PD38]